MGDGCLVRLGLWPSPGDAAMLWSISTCNRIHMYMYFIHILF